MSETAPERVVIERRFNGPPDSSHGGYVCGIVAALVARTGGGEAEVTLRRPPPLERPLDVVRPGDALVALVDGETVVAEGAPTTVSLDVPPPVSLAEARRAGESYRGFQRHVFPTCFTCGPRRRQGDGLRVFAGPVDGRGVVAAPWTPPGSLAGRDGLVRPEIVWAALDCPGAWSLFRDSDEERAVVLGRQAARLIAPVRAGEPHVVVGWPLGEHGRKLYSGTAVYAADGELKGFARATWVRIR